MATREEAIAILEKMKESKPAQPIDALTSKGLSFVLKYLSARKGEAYTNDISREMGISTAEDCKMKCNG